MVERGPQVPCAVGIEKQELRRVGMQKRNLLVCQGFFDDMKFNFDGKI